MSVTGEEVGAADAEVAGAVEMPGTDVDKRCQQYVSIRDKLKKMEDDYDKARKPLVEVQNLLQGYLMKEMERINATSIKTSSGTVSVTVRHTASLADPDIFMRYVIEHKEFDLLDRRANATACRAFVKAHDGNLPPGVNLSSLRSVGVTRPRKKPNITD